MAFSEITYDGGDPRGALIDFVNEVMRVLHMLAYRDVNLGSDRLPPDEILTAFQDALRAFIERGGLEAVLAGIRELGQAQIDAHGLDGPELTFKLDAVKYAEARYQAAPAWNPYRRLIDTFEYLLDSILAAVGGGGALQEIKGTGRNVYDVANG